MSRLGHIKEFEDGEVEFYFAVKVQSKENQFAEKDSWFWVTYSEEEKIEKSSLIKESHPIPPNVKLFSSEEEAEEFAKQWEGFPWWCQPNGNYEVVLLIPIIKKVVTGWTTE